MNRNFKKLWAGRLLSNFGDSIYSLTVSWYLIQATHEIFWVGVLNALIYLPTLFEFLVGHIVDRHKKKTLLIALEIGQAFGSLLLFLLLLLNIDFPLLLCISAFLCSLFGMNTYTTQDAFLPLLVAKEDMDKSQSYMIMAYQMSDYLFNGLIGFALKVIHPLFLIATSVASFVGSASIFNTIAIDEEIPKVDSESKIDWLEGFKLLKKYQMPLWLMLGETIANIMFSGLSIYIVQLAEEWNDPVFLGFFGVCTSIGVVIGSTLITTKVWDSYSRSTKMILGSLFYGIFMLLASLLTRNPIALLFMVGLASIFLGFNYTVHNPLILEFVPEQFLGRVLSAKSTIAVGIMPLASLAWGTLANYIPSHTFFVLFGLSYMLIALIYILVFPRLKSQSL